MLVGTIAQSPPFISGILAVEYDFAAILELLRNPWMV